MGYVQYLLTLINHEPSIFFLAELVFLAGIPGFHHAPPELPWRSPWHSPERVVGLLRPQGRVVGEAEAAECGRGRRMEIRRGPFLYILYLYVLLYMYYIYNNNSNNNNNNNNIDNKIIIYIYTCIHIATYVYIYIVDVYMCMYIYIIWTCHLSHIRGHFYLRQLLWIHDLVLFWYIQQFPLAAGKPPTKPPRGTLW